MSEPLAGPGMYLELATAVLQIRQTMGSEVLCLCPYHDDSTPSFQFNIDKGLWICFGCGKRGNAARLAADQGVRHLIPTLVVDPDADALALDAALNALDDVIAREALTCGCARTYAGALTHPPAYPLRGIGSTLSSSSSNTSSSKFNTTTSVESGRCSTCARDLVLDEKYLKKYLRDENTITNYWVNKRNIHPGVVEAFQLGWSPLRQAATIPYRSNEGLLLGVVQRALQGRPKYRYPMKFPRKSNLYGSWAINNIKETEVYLAKRGVPLRRDVLPANWVVLTEGSIDALSCWSAGIPAVAMWGSFLNRAQVATMVEAGIFGVVVFTDRDSAGYQAKRQALGELAAGGMTTRTVMYPRSYPSEWSDPGSMPSAVLRRRVSHARWQWDG